MSAKLFRHKGFVKTKPNRPYAIRLKRGQRLSASSPGEAIQIDGGSEFMAELEQACKRHHLDLAALAPKSPKLNGHVERINGTWRTDFYELYDLPTQLAELRPLLHDYMGIPITGIGHMKPWIYKLHRSI